MNILIEQGRVIDPASGRDQVADVAVSGGRIAAIGAAPAGFAPQRRIDARGCWVLPGLVDLAARLGKPGREHAHLLESEMVAAVAGGITTLVCPPDTEPVLDEPGLVEMLRTRAERLHRARVLPLGALTRGLQGKALAEMLQLTEAGCVAFTQADAPLPNPQVLLRALQYAGTFGYAVWLRPQDPWLGQGVAASGPLAMRMGLAGIPATAETIALHMIFELMRGMNNSARVHLCRLSSAAGVALLRQARAEGLAVTADVSINSLLLTDMDIGYYDSRARLTPPLRQPRDRDALQAALADGTLDALVSDHTPVEADAKARPFAEADPGATGLELLLPLAVQWGQSSGGPGLMRALQTVTQAPAGALGGALGDLQGSCGRLAEGGLADLCLFDPAARWQVTPETLRSQGKHTPFAGRELTGRVRCTLVGGRCTHGG
jgi:dihydroorotase